MGNRLLFLLIFCLLGFYLPAQINVGLGGPCMFKNFAILDQAMLDFAGRDTVSQMLESKTRILFNWEVDSLGCVYRSQGCRYKHNIDNLPENFLDRFTNYVIANKICFYICYDNNPMPDIIRLESDLRENFKNGEYAFINVAFPGSIMAGYDWERQTVEKDGRTLSQIEYMEAQIQKILSEE